MWGSAVQFRLECGAVSLFSAAARLLGCVSGQTSFLPALTGGLHHELSSDVILPLACTRQP